MHFIVICGDGAHERVIADAAPHMDAYNRMAHTIFGNFQRVAGLSLTGSDLEDELAEIPACVEF